MKLKLVALGDLARIRTGKLDANASSPNGKYPFFTCAINPLRIDTYSYECECVLVAGNGDLNIKYHNGRFDAYQRTYIVEPISQSLDCRYLYHFLDSYLAELRKLSIGGVIKYIKLGNLTDAQIPLPPLGEQRRIAVILDQVKRIGRLAAHRNQLITEMKASAFSQRFGNTQTNNKGWEAATISELVDLENGDRSSSYPSKGDIKTEGILFLSTKNIVDDELSLEKCQYISKEKFNSLSRGKLSRGDIVITLRGTLGRVAIFDCQHETGFINAQTLILRPRKIDPVFLHALFRDRTFRNALLRSSTGAAVPQLTSKQISNLVIPIPPIDQQIKFKNECNAIDSLKRNSLKSVDRNEKLSKSLTSQLIGF